MQNSYFAYTSRIFRDVHFPVPHFQRPPPVTVFQKNNLFNFLA